MFHVTLMKWLTKPDVTDVADRSFRDINVIISLFLFGLGFDLYSNPIFLWVSVTILLEYILFSIFLLLSCPFSAIIIAIITVVITWF